MNVTIRTVDGPRQLDIRAGHLIWNDKRIFRVKHTNKASITQLMRKVAGADESTLRKILEAVTGEIYSGPKHCLIVRLKYTVTKLCYLISGFTPTGQFEEHYTQFVECPLNELEGALEGTIFEYSKKPAQQIRNQDKPRTIGRIMKRLFKLDELLLKPTPICFREVHIMPSGNTSRFPQDGAAMSADVKRHQLRPGIIPEDVDFPAFIRDIAPLRHMSRTAYLISMDDGILSPGEYYEEGQAVLASDWEIMAWVRDIFWETGPYSDNKCGVQFDITHVSWYRSQWRAGKMDGQTGPGIVPQPNWKKIVKIMRAEGKS